MAARYKSAFASASGFCSANAAKRIGASAAVSSKQAGVAPTAPKVVAIAKPARASVRQSKRAA